MLEGSEFVNWEIPLGMTEVREVTLRNHGLAPVRFSNFQLLEGTSPSTVFRVTRSPLGIPGAVRSGDELIPGIATMELSFTPNDVSVHLARLTIDTDLSSHSVMVFNLRGRATP